MEVTCKHILDNLVKYFQADGAGDWNAVIQFNISGDKGGEFVLTIQDKTCSVTTGTVENPTATLKTDDQTWIAVSLNKMNPMNAFMSGKVSVGGNMGDIMKLNNKSIFPVPIPS